MLGDFDDLDFDVDLDELLRQWVYVDETGVDGAGESSELCDKTHVSLVDGLVGVGADDAAWNGTEGTDAAS